MRAEPAVEAPDALAPMAPGPALRGNPSRPNGRSEAQPRNVPVPANIPSTLAVPLRPVLDRLPPELMQRIRQVEVGDAHISLPIQRVLSQIAHGSVKITFGELRQLAPPGTFNSVADLDRKPVEIPLQEILLRLDPTVMSRRPVQKQVVVPADVTGPFGSLAQVTFSTTPLKPSAAVAQPAARAQAPAMPPAASVPEIAPVAPIAAPRNTRPLGMQAAAPLQAAQPVQPVARISSRVQAQPIAPVQPMRPPPSPFQSAQSAPVTQIFVRTPPPPAYGQPAAPVQPPLQPNPQPANEEFFFRKASPAQPAPVQPVYSPIAPEAVAPEPEAESIPMPELTRSAVPFAPITPIAPEPEREPEPIRFQAAPPAFAAPSGHTASAHAGIAGETKFLTVSLAELSQSWPEPVQEEIVGHQMTSSAVSLPFGMTEVAIKQGKVALPWKILRSWVKPPVFNTTSPHDAVVLELPLKVITPLFLAELRAARPQRKVAIDESIPDLFSGGPPASGAGIPAAVAQPAPEPPKQAPTPKKPADTNYYTRRSEVELPEEAPPVVKKGPSPGTAFLIRYATPNEIVSKAAVLDGVDGALIALPDGLLVASRIPPSMNADTVAAFLPQIFSRVSQCTKELRLGELNNLNFTVGKIPWKIFKVGAIYFAAFGRPGEPLPTAALAGIAAELDRKAK